MDTPPQIARIPAPLKPFEATTLSFVPREIFLTKGIGRHRERLTSFEEALRDAEIARFNLVHVSSIFPPHCRVIPRQKGLEKMASGQIAYCVMARNDTDEHHRLIASSVGLSIPTDPNQYGYLSEHHSNGENEDEAGDRAEDLAASMLATILGLDFDQDASWDKKKEIWKISGRIVRTTSTSQGGIGARGVWTTVLASAILLP